MKRRAFSLIELMLAMAITGLLVVLLANIANTTSNAWQHGEAQAESYSNARGAINLLGREMQGALIDLDLGFRVDSVIGEPNNFVLRFLSRRNPQTDTVTASTGQTDAYSIEKICYQLAWADHHLLPEVSQTYDEKHPTPVLIRTVSINLSDVFVIDGKTTVDGWTKNWGPFNSGGTVLTGRLDPTTGNTTEVAAENVLGWRVIPCKWDSAKSRIVADEPGPNAIYYDKYLKSNLAPRALQIKIASVPTRSVTRLGAMGSDWQNIRQLDALFDFSKLTESPFDNLLRQNCEVFDSTFYLSSKTP